MKYVLTFTQRADKQLQEVPNVFGKDNIRSSNAIRYVVQCHWMQFYVRILDHDGVLVKSIDYKNNADALARAHASYKQNGIYNASHDLARFIFCICKSELTKATLTLIRTSPKEDYVWALRQMQAPSERVDRNVTLNSLAKKGKIFRMMADQSYDLPFLGEPILDEPLGDHAHFQWGNNCLLTASPTWAETPLTQLYLRDPIDLADFAATENMRIRKAIIARERLRQKSFEAGDRDAYRTRNVEGPSFILQEFENLPVDEQLRVARELIDNIDEMPVEVANTAVKQMFGLSGVSKMLKNWELKSRCQLVRRAPLPPVPAARPIARIAPMTNPITSYFVLPPTVPEAVLLSNPSTPGGPSTSSASASEQDSLAAYLDESDEQVDMSLDLYVNEAGFDVGDFLNSADEVFSSSKKPRLDLQ